MDKWDKKESKNNSPSKIEKLYLRVNAKILSVIPKPIIKLIMYHQNWVMKHGIPISVKQYIFISICYLIYIVFFNDPLFSHIIIYEHHSLLKGTTMIFNLSDLIHIKLTILLLILAVFSNGGGGGGDDDKSEPDDSKDSTKELHPKYE